MLPSPLGLLSIQQVNDLDVRLHKLNDGVGVVGTEIVEGVDNGGEVECLYEELGEDGSEHLQAACQQEALPVGDWINRRV